MPRLYHTRHACASTTAPGPVSGPWRACSWPAPTYPLPCAAGPYRAPIAAGTFSPLTPKGSPCFAVLGMEEKYQQAHNLKSYLPKDIQKNYWQAEIGQEDVHKTQLLQQMRRCCQQDGPTDCGRCVCGLCSVVEENLVVGPEGIHQPLCPKGAKSGICVLCHRNPRLAYKKVTTHVCVWHCDMDASIVVKRNG